MKVREGRANVPEGLFAEEDSPASRRKSSASKVSGFLPRRRGSAPQQQSGRYECYHRGDDCSDRGTYTIELEAGDHDEEEARKMIDKVKKKIQEKPLFLELVDNFHFHTRLCLLVHLASVCCRCLV